MYVHLCICSFIHVNTMLHWHDTRYHAECWGHQGEWLCWGLCKVRGGNQTAVSCYGESGKCWVWVGGEHLVSLTRSGRGVKNRKSDLSPDVIRVSLTWQSLSVPSFIYLPSLFSSPPTKETASILWDPLMTHTPRPPLLLECLQCLGELGFSALFVPLPLLKHGNHSWEISTFENSCYMKYKCFLLCKFCECTFHVLSLLRSKNTCTLWTEAISYLVEDKTNFRHIW